MLSNPFGAPFACTSARLRAGHQIRDALPARAAFCLGSTRGIPICPRDTVTRRRATHSRTTSGSATLESDAIEVVGEAVVCDSVMHDSTAHDSAALDNAALDNATHHRTTHERDARSCNARQRNTRSATHNSMMRTDVTTSARGHRHRRSRSIASIVIDDLEQPRAHTFDVT